MNRRKAILRISLAGGAIAAAVGGYKWLSITKTPDLALADQNRDLIAALAETIIPATDSPGARDANVQDFIVKMIKDCTERKEQNRFISGLAEIQDFCRDRYGRLYQHCVEKEQEDALAYFEKKGQPLKGIAGKVEYRYMGRSFFAILKDYTVEGYCTSQPGATKGLAYLYIPGSFRGCIPLLPEQKAWATN
jgi:hypothetical protein